MYELQQLEVMVEQGGEVIMSSRKTTKTNSKRSMDCPEKAITLYNPS